ncbi:MAG TPA: hypothetical protein VF074_13030 [Pyrinomonadaceae bacterium]
MDRKKFWRVFNLAGIALIVLALGTATVFAQGKGRGGGGGRGSGGGGGVGGPPAGVGVDRGLGNASSRSKGRSDDGLNNASNKSNGRSDAGHDRARMASSRMRDADKELREHPRMAQALNMNANSLRSDYQAALALNPELKFGHFVAATRLGQNLGGRSPNITRDAILTGLASGRSIGQTLQDLGLSDDQADEARKRAEREIKAARKN